MIYERGAFWDLWISLFLNGGPRGGTTNLLYGIGPREENQLADLKIPWIIMYFHGTCTFDHFPKVPFHLGGVPDDDQVIPVSQVEKILQTVISKNLAFDRMEKNPKPTNHRFKVGWLKRHNCFQFSVLCQNVVTQLKVLPVAAFTNMD